MNGAPLTANGCVSAADGSYVCKVRPAGQSVEGFFADAVGTAQSTHAQGQGQGQGQGYGKSTSMPHHRPSGNAPVPVPAPAPAPAGRR